MKVIAKDQRTTMAGHLMPSGTFFTCAEGSGNAVMYATERFAEKLYVNMDTGYVAPRMWEPGLVFVLTMEELSFAQ